MGGGTRRKRLTSSSSTHFFYRVCRPPPLTCISKCLIFNLQRGDNFERIILISRALPAARAGKIKILGIQVESKHQLNIDPDTHSKMERFWNQVGKRNGNKKASKSSSSSATSCAKRGQPVQAKRTQQSTKLKQTNTPKSRPKVVPHRKFRWDTPWVGRKNRKKMKTQQRTPTDQLA